MAIKRKNMLDFLSSGESVVRSVKDGLKHELPIEKLVPRQGQPRKQWDKDELETLASTIRTLGMIQPIVVRPRGDESLDSYEIVAGERRWRAAQLAQLATVPVIVRHLDDGRAALYSLAENIARRDLNPMEQARGYHSIVQEQNLTQTELAEAIGQNVKTVNRVLRLLKLPQEIQELIEQERLTAKHGELLLGLPPAQQQRMGYLAAERGWSVRELERQLIKMGEAVSKNLPNTRTDSNIDREQTLWSEQLGADVKLRYWESGKVRIIITVTSLDEYQGIKERLLTDAE